MGPAKPAAWNLPLSCPGFEACSRHCRLGRCWAPVCSPRSHHVVAIGALLERRRLGADVLDCARPGGQGRGGLATAASAAAPMGGSRQATVCKQAAGGLHDKAAPAQTHSQLAAQRAAAMSAAPGAAPPGGSAHCAWRARGGRRRTPPEGSCPGHSWPAGCRSTTAALQFVHGEMGVGQALPVGCQGRWGVRRGAPRRSANAAPAPGTSHKSSRDSQMLPEAPTADYRSYQGPHNEDPEVVPGAADGRGAKRAGGVDGAAVAAGGQGGAGGGVGWQGRVAWQLGEGRKPPWLVGSKGAGRRPGTPCGPILRPAPTKQQHKPPARPPARCSLTLAAARRGPAGRWCRWPGGRSPCFPRSSHPQQSCER